MTLRARIAALLFFLSSGIAFSQPILSSPIECRRDDGSAIRYYLQLRAPEARSASLLVILQGSDCNSVRRIKAIARLEGVYPEADVLTVEKYGVTEDLSYSDLPERPDCPPEYLERDNPEQRVSDVDRVVRSVRAAYGYQKVVVIGGSEGSVVANLLSSRADYVDATVLFAGGGRYFLDDVLHSMKYTSSSEAELKKNVEGFTQFAQYLLSHEAFEVNMSNHGSNHSLNLSLPDSSADKVIADIRAWLLGKLGEAEPRPRA